MENRNQALGSAHSNFRDNNDSPLSEIRFNGDQDDEYSPINKTNQLRVPLLKLE
jgi:hypothetical protein